METLIIYATKHGSTEKCAVKITEKITDNADLCNLKKATVPDLAQYDKIIIGGSIHMGKIQKEVNDFCTKNMNLLKDKKVGLFICCMRDGDIAETELNSNFPQELLNNALVKDYFGGEFIFKNMNFLDRLIVKKVSKVDSDVSNIMEDKIDQFVEKMNMA